MSLFNTVTVPCPVCGEKTEISWAASVNADRRPDLREAILDHSFQSEPCPSCGTAVRLPPHLTYVDLARGNWIVANDVSELPNWQAHEADAKALFDETFGVYAPDPAREMGEGFQPRLVFGWPALREKLLCASLGLNDVNLELLKMAVMRSVPGTPLGEGLTLRLLEGDAETLKLGVTNDATEAWTESIMVPRSVYDDIAGNTEAWAELRGQLANEALVDATRFMVGE